MASANGSGCADALLPMEIESYVEALQSSTFMELGSLRWMEKHSRLEKLTLQAVVEALAENREEVVKDMIITHDKFPTLVHDVIMTELWREQILPKLMEAKPKTNFAMYTILYHEATCMNLIETILFHPDAAEALGDAALDLTDYCLRSLNHLVAKGPPEDLPCSGAGDDGNLENLESQSMALLFRIGFKCLTTLRYLIENLDKVTPGVTPRLIVSADTPMLLVQFLVQKPWRRLNKNRDEMSYECDQQEWVELKGAERLIIGKIEAQAWLAIFLLFMNSSVISTYEIHEYRRGQLLKLRSMLNEVSLDQLPILGEFQGWLNQLSMGGFPMGATKSPLLIEMLPPIRTALEKELKKSRRAILIQQSKELLDSKKGSLMEKAKMLASTYDFEAFEAVLPPSKCASCGTVAVKKCGRCRSVWYCSRECQVENWPKHKEFCDKITPPK